MWIGFLLGCVVTWTIFALFFTALLLEAKNEHAKRVLAMTRMLDAEQEEMPSDWDICAWELGLDSEGREWKKGEPA